MPGGNPQFFQYMCQMGIKAGEIYLINCATNRMIAQKMEVGQKNLQISLFMPILQEFKIELAEIVPDICQYRRKRLKSNHFGGEKAR